MLACLGDSRAPVYLVCEFSDASPNKQVGSGLR